MWHHEHTWTTSNIHAIETKTQQLSLSVCFDLFLEDSKRRICTKMSSFFPCCKTKPVFWQTGKNKRTIIHCLTVFWEKMI